jgi:hypothetical protein
MTAMPQGGAAPVIAMRGAGYYSSHTVGAKAVINAAGDLVIDALARMDLGAATPFAIADFGAADGGTSLEMMRRAIGAIRAKAASRPISITYTDLPHNDFSALFRLMHGLLPQGTPPQGTPPQAAERPLGAEPGVYTFASGTSFYRQIFPENSLSLGFSATAMHWLSRLPGPIADHVQAVGATPEEKAVFRRQSLEDWNTILLHRARELKPGGKLVLANFCEDEQGRYLGNTGGVNMFDSFAKHWRGLVQEGAITEAEYRAATFPQYYKTLPDFVSPFEDPESPVRRAGLALEHASTRVTGCPYAADFAAHGDPAAFAREYIPTLRSWTESTFFGALDQARPVPERQAIIERFYGAYQAEVAAAPEGHGMDYVHCFMVISK